MELQLPLGVDASEFGAAQFVVTVTEQVVYLLVGLLVCRDLFPDHFQSIFGDEGKNTYRARLCCNSSSGALASLPTVFVAVAHLALSLCCNARVALLDLAQD